MSRSMTPEEMRGFVLQGTRTAKLATTMADGGPHVMPVWFVLDGEDFVFNTGEASLKARNLRRDPRASLLVDDEQPPFAFVHVRGTATLSDDLDQIFRWATVIGGRYMGAERAEEFGRRNAVPGELLVRLTPERLITQADVAGY
jgi:PPOX class probable F420-dependent enzyme